MSNEKVKTIEGQIPVTLDRAGELCGVTEKTIRSWVADGMPVLVAGKAGRGGCKTVVDLVEVLRWYLEQDALDAAKTRLASAQADKHEMENAETRGDLARISVIAKEFADAVSTTQALLLAIPTKEARTIAAMNDANAVEHRLRNTINDALRQLAAYGSSGAEKRKAGSGADDGAVRAAAAANGKRVGRRSPVTQ